MHTEVRRIIADIKSLKIQGARNVAKSALEAFAIEAQNSTAKNSDALYKHLLIIADALIKSRPTEPMMRNLLEDVCRFTLMQIRSNSSMEKSKLALEIGKKKENLLSKMDADAQKLARHGAALIPDDAVVLTHCHSSTSTKVIKEAKKEGKKFSVICFETRPRYQGRTTATELVAAGIDVTLSVDGAMAHQMKKADIVIVGADSITSRGDLINKIGTSTLAHIAYMNDVSFYCAAELFKYNPMTLFGTREKIEERDPREVWEDAPKKLKIRNPAFEATAARYISGYITEAGVIPPQSLFSIASEKLGRKIIDDPKIIE
ncbi:S-methyl-5-thioribose-1-phosphate isomerase [Candidatus Micrarchaeota archaeon]|nr:S-methyl-5-thioribose-1-phosphate isomerase [Candidatus Micrarchaeota archaeon]